jgi:putative heme-binding domain-containing protein
MITTCFPIRASFSWIFFASLIGFSCKQNQTGNEMIPLTLQDTSAVMYAPFIPIKLPISKGVKLGNPIQISLGPGNLIYASNQSGEIYTLWDSDHDGYEDSTALYVNVQDYGLRSPVGFASKGDTVYIGTAQQVRAFLDQDGDFVADTSWVFFDQIPESNHPYEWTSGMRFDKAGFLYLTLASDSWNASPSPDPNKYRGAILKVSPDGKSAEKIATGIRSVPAMAFHESGELFFVDNEGGGNPTEELNRLTMYSNYGHNPAKYPEAKDSKGPEYSLISEIAPSGMEFIPANSQFASQGGNLLVSFYGPGERWNRGGLGLISISKSETGEFTYSEETIADIAKISDLAFGADGSLYLAHHGKADYWYNSIFPEEGGFYKIVYDPSLEGKTLPKRELPSKDFSKDELLAGKQLFAEQACLGCHNVTNEEELLGPNLAGIGSRMSRAEILDEINNPSERIKPSMMGVRIFLKDNRQLSGRILNSNEKELTLMQIGNKSIVILREEILKTENIEKSMMYAGLLGGLTEAQQNHLLSYLQSLN